MTPRIRQWLADLAPGAPQRPFLSLLGLLFVGGPLFLFGLVQVIENNVRAFSARQSEAIVFRAVLKRGVGQDAAEELATKWRDSGDWDAATVTLADDVFQSIPELAQWMNEEANRLLLTAMPLTVDLHPAGLARGGVDPGRLAESLESATEVDRVFYDREGVAWLGRIQRTAADVGLPLRILFLCLAALGSLAAGIALARAASGADAWPSDSDDGEPTAFERMAAWLPLASGFVAALALSCLHILVALESSLLVVYLTFGQVFFLVFAGAVLALVTEVARRFGSVRLPGAAALLGAGLALAVAAAPGPARAAATVATTATAFAAAGSTTAPLAAALPPSPLTAVTGAADIGALTARQRNDLLTACREEIERHNKTEEYLRECLTRSGEEGTLDEQAEAANRRKLTAARRDLDVFQRSLSQRYDTLRALRAGLQAAAGAPTLVAGDLAGGAERSRREVAECLLTGEARQALSMLDNDRAHFGDARKAVTALENEERRLGILRTHARQSPAEIGAEIERTRQETQALRAREALIQAAPEALPAVDVAAVRPAAARPTRTGAATPAATRRSASETLALPGARGDEGYLLLCPAGTIVHAVREGKVLHAAPMAGLGGLVTLDHGGGLSTLYGELEPAEIGVQVGQTVKAGDIVGTAGIVKGYQGRGGVRFEVRKNGELVKPGVGLPGLTPEQLDSQLLGKK